jgi:myosin-5
MTYLGGADGRSWKRTWRTWTPSWGTRKKQQEWWEGFVVVVRIAHLLRELTIFHQVLQLYGVDPTLIAQVFRQLLPSCIFVGYIHFFIQYLTFLLICQVFYYICACALNNLLLRKEMCHWSRGIQIRNTSPILKNGCVTRIFMDRTLWVLVL